MMENTTRAIYNTDVNAIKTTDIEKRISGIEKCMQDLADILKNNHRYKQARGRSGSRDRQQTTSANGMCYYHDKFRDKSFKCRAPCNYNGPDLRKQAEN